MNQSLALASLLLATFVTISTADDTISFNRDVRTILADKCYACHGPDENKREADLRQLAAWLGAMSQRQDEQDVRTRRFERELAVRQVSFDENADNGLN